MKAFFNQLFDYNFYFNKKLIEAYGNADNLPEKSIALFSHILNVHHLWNTRLLDSQSKYEAFQLHDPSLWADIHYENQRNSFEVVIQTGDFDKRIEYQNEEG